MGVASAGLVALLATFVALGFTLPEALSARHHGAGRAQVRALFWRRSLGRAASLTVLVLGLVGLASCAAGAIWSNLDAFLLRPPTLTKVASEHWISSWLVAAVGAAALVFTFPPMVAWGVGLALAVVAAHGWFTAVALLPLAGEYILWLREPALATVGLGCALVLLGRLRAGRLDRGDNLSSRDWLAGSVALVVLAAEAVGAPWLRAARLLPIALLAGLLLATVLLGAGTHRVTWTAYLDRLLGGRRSAVLRLVILAVYCHAAIALAGWSMVLDRAERRLDGLAMSPTLLLASPVGPSDWAQAADQLAYLADRFAHHPLAGRHLLLAAWVRAEQLNQSTRAKLLLRQAAAKYEAVRAIAPLGWPPGLTVGEVARAALKGQGITGEPGLRPS